MLLKTNVDASNETENSEDSAKMYHKEMFLYHIWHPIIEAFKGTLEHITAKFLLLLAGLPALLKLELFETPELWWKGLLYLVILDWVGGVVKAIKIDEFSLHTAVRKWYQVVGYIIVCVSVAILANSIPKVFYYFQFAVYATFFLKEFVSILRTWRMLAMVEVVWDMLGDGGISLQGFREFKDEVDRRAENTENEKRAEANGQS